MIDNWFWDGGSLQIDPNDPNTIWACGNTTGPDRFAVARSANAGASWTRWYPLGAPSGNTAAQAMALHPSNSGTAWVAGYDDNGLVVMKTTNTGNTWSNLNTTGLNGNDVRDMIIKHDNPQVLYVATDQGVYRSTNGAQSFQKVSSFGSTLDILINPDNSSELFASTMQGGVYTSTDGGTSWSEMSWGLNSNAEVYMLALDKLNNVLYAGVAGSSHYRIQLYTGVEENSYTATGSPLAISVSQNPCATASSFSFSLPSPQEIAIEIYNTAGRLVETLDSGYRQTGTHEVLWSRSGQPPGVYFVRLRTECSGATAKLVLL